MADVMTKEQRRKNMQHMRNKDTQIELLLRKKLWEKGYRYRKNYKGLPGKPDIVLTKYRLVIFCDGDFFHGKDWETRQVKILQGNNGKFWFDKISRNIERDKEIDWQLKCMGWTVLRFWGSDIKKDLDGCIKAVEETVFDIMMESLED